MTSDILPFRAKNNFLANSPVNPQIQEVETSPHSGNIAIRSPKELALCSMQEARELVPYHDAVRWNILPLAVVRCGNRQVLTVAGRATHICEIEKAIRFLTGCDVNFITSGDVELSEATFLAYRSDVSSVEEITSALKVQAAAKSSVDEQDNNLAQSLIQADDTRSPSIPILVARMLEHAISREASDLAIEPLVDGVCRCTLRINGILKRIAIEGYSSDIHEQVVKRTRVLGGLSSVGQVQEPLDGVFSIPLPSSQREIRFHIFPTVAGAKLHFRLPQMNDVPPISELGLSAKTRNFLESVLERDRGAILLSGPTGSGKSTSAYSMLNYLQKQSRSIVSLEDPVERDIMGISQTDLSRLSTITYANGIRHILRQDPDALFIGEIRDTPSAKAALEAAASGHFLITSIHSSRAIDALERLARLSEDRQLVAEVMQLVICQQLVPSLCKKCRVIDLRASDIMRAPVYQAVGCAACDHSGYSGRTLIEESLYLTSELRERFIAGGIGESMISGRRFFQGLDESVREALCIGSVDVRQVKKIIVLPT